MLSVQGHTAAQSWAAACGIISTTLDFPTTVERLLATLRDVPSREWAGLFLGLALRVFSILWLGPMFTRFVQIIPCHRLVTNGPYRFVRRPSYSGLLLFFMGLGIALGNWLSVAVMVLVPALGVLYRIRVEEEALLERSGRSTGRIWAGCAVWYRYRNGHPAS